jgi:hypothetical protein
MFVCPGLKEVPLEYAIFPLGSGFLGMEACPIRECCAWYSSYDLGGEQQITDFPDDAILPANFATQPFQCRDFKDANDPL